jgi:hypothetical protein
MREENRKKRAKGRKHERFYGREENTQKQNDSETGKECSRCAANAHDECYLPDNYGNPDFLDDPGSSGQILKHASGKSKIAGGIHFLHERLLCSIS